ncbi:MAG: hypothetical protein K6E54_06195 [Bacteroidaceae bacterium]|nr:hypothetical protein [Bacteroidaceae bacterium]
MKYEGDTKEIRSVAEGGGVENYTLTDMYLFVKYDKGINTKFRFNS